MEHWQELQQDIKPYGTVLDRATRTVVDEGVSNYPILVAYPGAVPDQVPGIFVLEIVTDRNLIWTVNLTTLEELVAKRVIPNERVDPFRKVYRDKPEELCWLILDESGARFAFVAP